MKIRKLLVTILIVFSIIPALLTSTLCIVSYTNNFRNTAQQALQNAASTQADTIEIYWQQQEDNLRTITSLPVTQSYLLRRNAGAIGAQDEAELAFLNTTLQTRVEQDSMVEEASLVDLEGRVIASSNPNKIGAPAALNDSEKAALVSGQGAVSELYYNTTIEPNEKYFHISAPFLSQGAYAGCLVFSCNLSRFSQVVSDNKFLATGALAVLDMNANIVVTSSKNLNKSAFEIAQKNTLSEQLREVDLEKEPTGFLFYTIGDDKKMACYSAIGDTGWCVLSIAMRAEYMPSARQIGGLILGTVLITALLTVFAFILITRFFSLPLNGLVATIRRIQCGNYNRRFTARRQDELAEIGAALNQMMDKIVTDNRELILKEERYRIVSEQADNAIFEYNIKDKTMYHTANFVKKFGYEPPSENMPEALYETDTVHPDDQPLMTEFFSHILSGQEDVRTEARLLQVGTGYIWCAIHATTIFDEKHHPVRAVGSVADIDKKKKETAQLIAKAQRDPLTGLYNKSTTELLIQESLEYRSSQATHALFVIDVDNFKLFNDNFGHLFGDKILKDIAKKITATFRSTDIIGRVGGDEFVLFIKDLADVSHVYEKASTLITIFEQTYASPSGTYSVSSSIGIALYPRDGKTFTQLFKNADQALYTAKHLGKNRYSVFQQEQTEQEKALQARKPVPAKSEFLSRENLTEYVFRTLYGALEIEPAVTQVLEMLGKYFRVCRVYIFEASGETDPVLRETFAWHAHGTGEDAAPPLPVRFGGLNYPDLFNEDQVFYCEDVSILPQALQDFMKTRQVRSLLQCEIREDGVFRGLVGFDDCTQKRIWTKQEIDALALISNLLSVFLLKARASSRLQESKRIPQEILDAQDLWSYVIDPDTFQLLFINKKAKELVPGARLGQTCYRVFFQGQEAPCADCPAAGLAAGQGTCTREIYNPHLQVWTSATACDMQWSKQKHVCLVCCTDITKYKQNPDGADA